MKTNCNLIDKFTILVLVSAPFMDVYATPIPSVGLCDLLLLPILMYYLFYNLKYRPTITAIFKYKLALAFLTIGNYFVVMLYTDFYMSGSITGRTLRYLVYLVIGLLFNVSEEHRKTAIKYLEACSILGTGLIILQNIVLKASGYYIAGLIPFLKPMNEAGFKEQISNIYHLGGRPFSFFSEPSTYGIYVGLCLAIELYIGEKGSKNFFIRWFLTLGLILSGSTTGLASVVVLYAGVFIQRILHKNFQFQIKDALFVTTLMPIFIFVLFGSSTVQTMILRLQNGASARNRFAGYKIFHEPMPLTEMLFGHGMNMDITDFFLAGIPRLYYYWGIAGTIIVAALLIFIYVRIDRTSRIILLYVLFINIAAAWTQLALVTFLLWVEKDREQKKQEIAHE